jgi:uncharacterized protein YigA (DUF484 family)
MSERKTALSAAQIEEYLEHHPDFFNEHLNLLEQMSIPHPSGTAVSLISKQLEIFRNRHHELENQLNSLIEIARNNDASFIRMHKLTLALLEASTLDQAVANIDTVLAEYFFTDFVALRIIQEHQDPFQHSLFLKPNSVDLKPFLKELTSNQPKCGRPTLAQAKILFGKDATAVKSCAIIPMNFTELEGILAIGSREEDRFQYSMGNLFLNQMSEVIGTRLISLLRTSCNAR